MHERHATAVCTKLSASIEHYKGTLLIQMDMKIYDAYRLGIEAGMARDLRHR